MRLTLAHASESRRHPGRLQFDLLRILAGDEVARSLGLVRGSVGGKPRSLTVVVDGTLVWIELWPAIDNSPRVPLPNGEVVEVPRFRLDDDNSDPAVRIVASRCRSERPSADREPYLDGTVRVQLFSGSRDTLRSDEQWVSVEIDLEPATSNAVRGPAVPARGGRGAAAD